MKGEINCIVFSSLINPLFRTLDHFAQCMRTIWNYRSESLRKLYIWPSIMFLNFDAASRGIVVLVTCLFLEVYLYARCELGKKAFMISTTLEVMQYNIAEQCWK